MTQKIIIDTDPGIDDALAILLALAHPKLDVVGLTTVFGNVPVSLATDNALRIADTAQSAVPVAAGAATPLFIPPRGHADFVHGQDGLGNTHPAQSARQALDLSAAAFIVQQVRSAPDDITLVPVGPLTNLALALKLAPDIAHKTRVVLMGGAVHEPGNCSPVAEANIWQDPHAAEIVFAADWHVTMVGLDATHQVRLDQAFFDACAAAAPRVGGFLNTVHQFYLDFYASRFGERVCAAHDALAVAAVVEPSVVTTEPGAIRVCTEGVAEGQTLLAKPGEFEEQSWWRGRPVHRAALGADATAVRQLILETLADHAS
ncbi:MAG: nucleoside hydrolase [Pseudomonadota bacterium]